MARITFNAADGQEIEIHARTGFSLMEVAVNAGVAGIDGECGGGCSCATCHIFISPEFLNAIDPATEYEEDLLECLDIRQPNSRLSCQVKVSDALDGVAITVPQHQGIA